MSAYDNDSQSEEILEHNDQNTTIEKDTIRIEYPQKEEIVSSPLEIRGLARGSWFFEGIFTARLIDENGTTIAMSNAVAKDEWMTDNFVPFQASMVFDRKGSENGTLILSKSNPSGIVASSEDIRVSLRFK